MAFNPDPVMQAARTGDPDRYISALYAPQDVRAGLFALIAFNAEIGAIRGRVHEPALGELRLQWWRDALAKPSLRTGNPLADGLNAAILRYRLPASAFQNYLDARTFDLYDDPMPSRTDLEGYCGETESAVIQLSALMLDAGAAPGFADLAGRAGCAQGIATLLRMLPLHRARGQCYVPRDILDAAGSSPADFSSDGGRAGAARAVEAMVALGREHLAAFEAGARSLPPRLRPAFLPLALTGPRLRNLSNAALLRGGPDLSAARRQWLLLRRALWGWR